MIDKKNHIENGGKIKILVVEDEVLLAHDIIQRLTIIDYEVVGFAMTANSAIELIKENIDVDLLLIDIMIKGDKDGIQLAEIIKVKYNIPFIFLTSNADQQVVRRAHKVEPYAYILKPFNDRQVSIAIELALLNFSKNKSEPKFIEHQKFGEEDNQVMQIKNCLFLKKNNHYKRVSLNEILFIQADNNYSTVYTRSEKFLYAIVMKKIEDQLPKNLFLKTHRSYIVNTDAIEGYEGNMLFVEANKIPISKSHRANVFRLFKTI